MQTIAVLIFILTVQVALGQDHRVAVEGQIIPLNMELNSVDDQYEGCTENMEYLVETEFLEKEISGNSAFAAAWKEGVIKAKAPEYNLTRNHSVSIYVYTSNRVYKDFNNATRSDKQKYINMTFTWYSLHFLLTEAIQILRKMQNKCQLTYRGTNVEFDKDVLHKEVRFGSFVSSSLDRTVAEGFGRVSCFEIETCEGAYVAKYSVFHGENEVLIPPFEKFNVTALKIGSWCKTVYELKSSGRRSDLNCAVASELCDLSVKNSVKRSDLICPVGSVESQIHHRCQYFWLASLYIFIHYFGFF
ncbi:erythroblast NAD(P)(+)--arginine ADP-ribosyltransferase-like [Myxocyprinus asiaticus]|uniref:erythroblast NAD(P)(+)--arginine ADP-ribosyltransferase-like n=1 Tax=Myxocyprinus asiaticus TaxID=70543 RepID=UPI002221A598|nr:erythroblast NAD(P)(+)--arginine ADP-ribosyltransferase-like [Myxocyprinus asiaticus]